ncbi:conserved hypothetical protein [Neospora caninum Liverpool]|uniref:Uncharacterized protein n=1 Tax=Neospora caninum (strain Liverpool) TaxID=572307 RepID=F0VEF1_NEOCL|nr:conserved hypothetical protein [Neospora caninum Liverpool]CBZ52095.1 conserved hypothetical protein [Neospora caninum Liverpool]CEL66057.1 TPA: hypothetical protein BN1204_018840 [Neospora caninum Liverpool]|eukprot:XP_003882127.1 conserved hypothetical protein [Neospora caninum Liverpool]
MVKIRVLLAVICVTGSCLFAQGIPNRLRGGETRRLLEEAPHLLVYMFQKMNEMGKTRGQFRSFYDSYSASKQSNQSGLPGEQKHLRDEAVALHEQVQRLKADLKKDAENVREFLGKLKRCWDDGNAAAAGRDHEVQLTIWKVTEVLHQVEEVLKTDDNTYGGLLL